MEKIQINDGLEKEVLAYLIATGKVKMEDVRETANFLNSKPPLAAPAHEHYFTK